MYTTRQKLWHPSGISILHQIYRQIVNFLETWWISMSIPAPTTSFLRSIINHDAVNNIQRLAPAIIKVRKHRGTLVMQIDSDTMGRVSEEFRWRIVALHACGGLSAQCALVVSAWSRQAEVPQGFRIQLFLTFVMSALINIFDGKLKAFNFDIAFTRCSSLSLFYFSYNNLNPTHTVIVQYERIDHWKFVLNASYWYAYSVDNLTFDDVLKT